MDKFEAQHAFWSSFSVPAYEENSVPDEPTLKELGVNQYITYQKANGIFGASAVINPRIWTRSESWNDADALELAVQQRLEKGDHRIFYSGGMIWATPEENFAQSIGDPDDPLIKGYRLAVRLQFL